MRKYSVMALFISALMPLLVSCESANPTLLNMVKSGIFPKYSKKTVGIMIDSFFEDVKWSSKKSPDGQDFVIAKGKILYSGSTVEAKIIFKVETDQLSFKVDSLLFNEAPQNSIIVDSLFEKMYENVYPISERLIGLWYYEAPFMRIEIDLKDNSNFVFYFDHPYRTMNGKGQYSIDPNGNILTLIFDEPLNIIVQQVKKITFQYTIVNEDNIYLVDMAGTMQRAGVPLAYTRDTKSQQ